MELTPRRCNVFKLQPGIRPDNEHLLYNHEFSEDVLKEYWKKPFTVKPDTGFYDWRTTEVFHLPHETHLEFPETFRKCLLKFFLDPTKVKSFMELLVIDNEKVDSEEEKFVSRINIRFFTNLVRAIGPEIISVFAPYLKEYYQSEKDSHQICAAEIVSGMIRGSRMWNYEEVSKIWNEILTTCLKSMLTNISNDTHGHLITALHQAVRRVDPNRVKWLYNILLEHLNLEFATHSTPDCRA